MPASEIDTIASLRAAIANDQLELKLESLLLILYDMAWFNKKICDLTEKERVYIDKVMSWISLLSPMKTYTLAFFEHCIYKCKGGNCIFKEDTIGGVAFGKILQITQDMELRILVKGELTENGAVILMLCEH